MKALQNLIENSISLDLDYYQRHISIVEDNFDAYPDICVEACKAIIESISKTILNNTGNSALIGKKENLSTLFKKAVYTLHDKNENVEKDYTASLAGFIHKLGEIRTARGDISHGQICPKEQITSPSYARFIANTTDAIASFLLSELLKVPASNTAEEEDVEQITDYHANENFNNFLDESTPLSGGLSYSRALFDQDYDGYNEERERYIADKEEEIETV